MRNGWITATLAVLIWLTVVAMNVSLLVLIAMGKGCRGKSCSQEYVV